jgi:hypothetical protein
MYPTNRVGDTISALLKSHGVDFSERLIPGTNEKVTARPDPQQRKTPDSSAVDTARKLSAVS